MAGKPVACVGDMHICPMCSGTVPHVGGPITGPGMAGATINGKPIAVMGDMCTCAGPPDVIAQGCAGVTINGVPVATVGSMTAHGGQITMGQPGVTVGPRTPDTKAKATMAQQEVPFPDIKAVDRICASFMDENTSTKVAEENQEQLKKEDAEQEPKIYNLRWIKEEKKTKESKEAKSVELVASVMNISDGETISFKVEREQKDGSIIEKELSGTVNEGKVKVKWEIEEEETNEQ